MSSPSLSRLLLPALLVGSLAACGGEDEGAWKVEVPASALTGDPVSLKWTLEPRRHVETTMEMDLQLGPPEDPDELAQDILFTWRYEVRPRNADGLYELTGMAHWQTARARGRDLLEGFPQGASAEVRTLVDASFLVREQTYGKKEFPPSFDARRGDLDAMNLLGIVQPPEKALRVGEVERLPAEAIARHVTILTTGEGPVTGDAYRWLEAIEDHDGARCARLRTVFAFTHELEKGAVRYRGEGALWFGLDGYVREQRIEGVIEQVGYRGLKGKFRGRATSRPSPAKAD